ncbi:restriction endonuclease [Dendrosporobacter sp. 1207_IL3150]|uniref:restriction endonuclease n=1 Tax=Dendrosporobacter sp. 1207_IL3150 TaxID=3084054 RepID=UPI002FDA7654
MKNIWLVRAFPNGHDRFELFNKEQIIAIGWSKLTNLEGKSMGELRDMLRTAYPEYDSSGKVGQALAAVNAFVNGLRVDDLVMVPSGQRVLLGIIESGYYYDSAKKNEGYCHQRKVKWLFETTRDIFEGEVKVFLSTRNTIAKLRKRTESVWAMVNEQPESDTMAEEPALFEAASGDKVSDLIKIAEDILLKELSCNEPERQLKVALEILKAKGKL